MLDEQTDEEISRKVQQGDTQAFGELVLRYEDKLQRYAKRFLFDREDGQDLVQDVFLKAYTNLQSFDPSQRFSPWIYRIAHNEFINVIKKKGRQPLSFFDPDTLFPHPTAKERPDTDIQQDELREMLERCLDRLDDKYREPLVLFYYEDQDYQAMAEILRIPVSTVGVRLSRGKAALQKIYLSLPQ